MGRFSGRTLVVGQSGGATAVINASLVGVVDGALASGAFDRVLGMRHAIEGLIAGKTIDLGALGRERLAGLLRTPSSALGTGRYKLQEGDLDRVLERLKELDSGAMVYIGGNDSADTAHRLHEHARAAGNEVRVVSVPKTVDNDLPGTDHCPGFPSIARFMGNAVRDATYDSLASPSLYPVKIIQVMGRDAGWVAASGMLGFNDDETDLLPLIYLPERPPASADATVAEIDARVAERGLAVVVLPETLHDAAGRHFGGDVPEYVDAFGHPYFPDSGAALARLVATQTGHRARYEKPGSAARMSISLASRVDLEEAYALGRSAAERVAQGESDVMTTLVREANDPYVWSVGTAPLAEVANRVRTVSDEFIAADGRSMTEAFRTYALPLLGRDPFPPYVRLPRE
jgi:6-phosphofructokinase 1